MKNQLVQLSGTINKLLIGCMSLLIIILIISSCGNRYAFNPKPPLPDDTNHVPVSPESRGFPVLYEGIDKVLFQQIKEAFDFSRQFRRLFGKPKEALNRNAFDEVANSSWYTNRHYHNPLSLHDIVKGPNTCNGPSQEGNWAIIRAKLEGVTPGFTIKDPNGDYFLIKFDPKNYSEIATGAEVISTKLFYAAGYNTPENYLVYFHPDILKLADNVKLVNEKGRKAVMTEADIEKMFKKISIMPDGRIRALASKYVPGKPIGPFTYNGFRDDDPNDYIPHQHRRELRGLGVISAWLKHTDVKDGNSLDSYVTENGKSYVRHFLIDFGSTLGSAAHGPFSPEAGYVNQVDPSDVFHNSFTLGLDVKGWEKDNDLVFPSIGRYRADIFEPHKFKSNMPNPAFDLKTDLDGFWAAKIVMSFTDEQLAAVVKEARYSNPDAELYLLKTLKERRDIIGHHWFSLVNPLDNFRLVKNNDGPTQLLFDDLAVSGKLESSELTEYESRIVLHPKKPPVSNGFSNSPEIELPDKYNSIYGIDIRTIRQDGNRISSWTTVFFENNQVVGLKRK